jgi:competence protein ComEC
MRRKSLILAKISVCLLLASVTGVTLRRPPDAVIDFLDVGQGDAALVSVGHAQMLIDGGPDATVLAKLGNVMPFTDRTIEAVVLTHPHADHFVGLLSVLERYRVDTVMLGGDVNDTPEYRAFEDAVRRSGAKVARVVAGDNVALGDGAAFDVLWPPRHDDLALDDRDPNSWSVVLRMRVGESAALLMGDAPDEIEARLVASGTELSADVLKVGHHGSRHSSSAPFLRAVAAEEAVVSVGKNNYGHPAWAALKRLESAGSRVWRTDRDGDVRVIFNKGIVSVRAKEKRRSR